MNRSNVRVAVFSAGIVSGLLPLLYLPVLIWSPPWGGDGYYKPTRSDPTPRNWIYIEDTAHIEYKLISNTSVELSKQVYLFRPSLDEWNKTSHVVTIIYILWVELTADSP